MSDDWLTFSNFKSWMLEQDWEGNQIDKDLLYHDNKVYSSLTCIFISQRLNTIIAGVHKSTGLGLKGTWYDVSRDNYQATGRKYPSGSNYMIGRYPTEVAAHKAWAEHKIKVINTVILEHSDKRIIKALNRIIGEVLDNLQHI